MGVGKSGSVIAPFLRFFCVSFVEVKIKERIEVVVIFRVYLLFMYIRYMTMGRSRQESKRESNEQKKG